LTLPDRRVGHWDIVVIGAGSAGCALAGRLSENVNRAVLVLEAGPDFPPPARWPDELVHGSPLEAADYLIVFDALYTESQSPALTLRGRVVGGSSAVNGGWFFRGQPADYDAWGSELWSYPQVEVFFKKLENDLDFPDSPIHGNSGPTPVKRVSEADLLPHQVAFGEAVLRAGFKEKIDLGNPLGEGIGRLPMNKVDGRRVSAAMAYIDPVRSRPNLTIWGSCLVTRVLVEGGRAIGVQAQMNGELVRIEADQVVLSAGGLLTPQLLIQSGIGPAQTLHRLGIPVRCDLDGVGKNVHDHPQVDVELAPPDRLQPRQTDPMHQLVLIRSLSACSTENDAHIIPGFVFAESLTYKVVLQRTVGSGELEFQSGEPGSRPRIHYRYLEHEADLARFRESVRLIVELLDQPSLRELGANRLNLESQDLSDDRALDKWIIGALHSSYHTSGTCRMGPTSDAGAVVDDRGRLHGIDNLILADLSVAPDVPRAPANATALMIGERIAELVSHV
jgi:choline dehydrogenase